MHLPFFLYVVTNKAFHRQTNTQNCHPYIAYALHATLYKCVKVSYWHFSRAVVTRVVINMLRSWLTC